MNQKTMPLLMPLCNITKVQNSLYV